MRIVSNQVIIGITGLLVFGLFTGCAAFEKKPVKNGEQKIEGSVWYRERMLLPPNAEVCVALEDVARMDVPADVMASTCFTPLGGPPWNFSLPYDSARLHDKGRYALRARIAVDGRLIFINTGHVPAFDGEPGTPVKVMVSRVGQAAVPMRPAAELVNTYWKLSELDGKPAKPGAGKKDVHLVFTDEEKRVRGFSGCNQFTGTYEKKKNRLKFGPLAATMMACAEGMQQEQAFLKALGKTVRYTVSGDHLMLYSKDEKLILRFKAAYQE